MNENYEIPVRALPRVVNDDYERPVKDSNMDGEYNTIASEMDKNIKITETPSGYTKTRTVILLFVITVIVSVGICVAIYFVSSMHCNCKSCDQVSVTNKPLVGNITTDVTGDNVASDASTGLSVQCVPKTTPMPTTLQPECPGGWTKYNNSCYHFGRGAKLTFYAAVNFCGQYNAVVVQIDSSAENQFIKDDLNSNSHRLYWIGLTDEENETFWRWYGSNDYITYNDWTSGYPNGGAQPDAYNCVVMDLHNQYKWANTDCGWALPAPICELNIST